MAFDAEFARHTAPAVTFDAARERDVPAHDNADLFLAALYLQPRPCEALDALIAG